uniref:Uncharacterized protein n=1 Tax=Cacopsylla melanoneura TaxID=428564 RepID=A0A8D8R3A2_9HEMI
MYWNSKNINMLRDIIHGVKLSKRKLSNVDLNTDSYKILLQEIHRDTVNQVVADYKPNRVLDAAPPEVDEAEKNLARSARTALAQLRSGWCCQLRNYQHRSRKNLAAGTFRLHPLYSRIGNQKLLRKRFSSLLSTW